MYNLDRQQRYTITLWLAVFHIFIVTISNYLVQMPFPLFGFYTTWGALTFPFLFLATDLTIRIFGTKIARRIIFFSMLPALFTSYLVSILFTNAIWQGWEVLVTSDLHFHVVRIALASFLAYLTGQILDIYVFNRLRHLSYWWIAPSVGMILANILDTLIFFSVAFYRSTDPFMSMHWVEIALVDYCFKIFFSLIFYLPIYGLMIKSILRYCLVNNSHINHCKDRDKINFS